MGLIGSTDKRCVVGRPGHSAKTKEPKSCEIDVLIFQFEAQAARYFNWLRYTATGMEKNVFTFVRFWVLFKENRSVIWGGERDPQP